MKTYLQLIEECDNFPHPTPASTSSNDLNPPLEPPLYRLLLPTSPLPYGYLLPSTIAKMPWTPSFHPNHHDRTLLVSPPTPNPLRDVTAALADVLARARESRTFAVLTGWRDELYPIIGAPGGGDICLERAGSALFGILTMGVHMTVYVRSADGRLRIWVPRRAVAKQTYPGMLDNSVAGGITVGETPFAALVREAGEEAALPASLVRASATACGTVSYFHVRDERTGGETGLLQPEVQYVYDLEVGEEVELRPADGEVSEFYLWGVEAVQAALGRGEFKPNCAVVLVDFLVRHGVLTAENEADYVEIVARLHRRLPFPTKRGRDGAGVM